MHAAELLHSADRISTWVGKAFAWLIVVLTLVVAEVFKRYALNIPHAWIYDVNNMLYGTLFMMAGAYTLSQDGHVRGDFLYGSLRPRMQAGLDLVLYIVFFLPGVVALTWAGWVYSSDSRPCTSTPSTRRRCRVYPFKFVIPLAGAIVLMQGLAEILRCIVCMRTGAWPPRMKDAEEIDVVKLSSWCTCRTRTSQTLDAQCVDAGARAMKMRKELWFGFVIMALIVASGGAAARLGRA